MTEQPDPIRTEPVALRDRIADALTAAAAHDCDATCGLDERACYAHPITWSALVALPPGTFHIDGPVTAIADVVLAVLRAPVGPDDPGTEAVSPQARPGRPTASEITDDQLDALHAENARLRAELDDRPIQVLVDEGIQQLRGELNATRAERGRYAATLREVLDTFDLGYGPGDVFAGASSPPIAPDDFNRWRAALGLPPVDTAPWTGA